MNPKGMDDFETYMQKEIDNARVLQDKFKSVADRVARPDIMKGVYHNEGIIAGLAMALQGYRKLKGII